MNAHYPEAAQGPSQDLGRSHRLRALAHAIEDCAASYRQDTAILCAAALEDLAAGPPDLDMWTDVRARAEEWIEFANPIEIEAYGAVILRRIGRTPWGLAARKRLLVDLWSSLGPVDRRRFLARVDAEGRFVGRAA